MAGVASEADEAVREDAARKVGVKLVLNKARQRRAGRFALGKVGLRVRGHHAIQRCLFGAVAQVGQMDVGACGHRARCSAFEMPCSMLVLYTVYLMFKLLFLLYFCF